MGISIITSRTNQILYGSDFGITADGVTDDTAAFNTFMAACKAGQEKGELPNGSIRLTSKPNDIDFAWDIGGKGLLSTVVRRDYDGVGSTGCFALVDNSSGTRIHDMSIQSTVGKTAGSMISIISSASFAVSGVILENLWLTTAGTDTQNNTIFFDGSAKTTAPTGVRDLSLSNVHVFGSAGFSAILKSVIGLNWQGGGVYVAGGTGAASGGIQIAGVTTVKSQYIALDINVSAGLNLTNCLDMKLAIAAIGTVSGVSVNNDSTCSFTQVLGHPSGTVSGNWVSSGIRRTSAAYATT